MTEKQEIGAEPQLAQDPDQRGGPTLSVGDRDVPFTVAMKWVALVVMLVLPFTMTSYYTGLFVRAYIFGIFAIAVDILWGYSGILTFGHAAFFGTGAYLMAKVLKLPLFVGDTYLGLVMAGVLPGVVGLVVAGLLFYRGINEAYFTIITLAIAVIANQIATSWQSVTGGFNGLTGVPPISIGIPGISMVPLTGHAYYYTILVTLIAVYLVAKRVVASRFGTALVAIMENEEKARALGYNIPKYKTIVFGVSSGLAGFAGALYTGHAGLVSPNVAGFVLSTQVLLWVLIGGRGTLIGPIIGAVFLVLFEDTISSLFQFGWTLLLGIVLVVIVLSLPGGLMELLGMTRDHLAERESSASNITGSD